MRYRQDIDTCLQGRIGEQGLDPGALDRTLDALLPEIGALAAARDDGSLSLLTLPAKTDDLADIRDVARRYRDGFAHVLVLGTGGSSLGGETLVRLARDRAAPAVHFLENVDPDGFDEALDSVDLAATGVLLVSKSGTTAETLSQTFALLPRLEAASAGPLSARVTVISDPPKGDGPPAPLRRLAKAYGFPVLDHEPGIGGRFAALTNVGLLPAAIAGLAPEEIREGAGEVVEASLGVSDAVDAPPALGAAVSVAAARERGLSQTVLMPYIDRLKPFAYWYRQLWAESLGKDGRGTTPIAAHGTVDQHSQLQLWLAGPADKLYTLILGDPRGVGAPLDVSAAGGDDLAYLAGRTLGDLLAAEQEATLDTLVGNGRPVRAIRIEKVDGATVGALMMHFMLETILAARLLDVDPFDQPAVEEGKVLARRYLSEMAEHGQAP